MSQSPIRVLHVVPDLRVAGVETFIMNMYRNIDRSKVQFDFLVHYEKRAFYDQEAESLGAEIFRLRIRENKNFIEYLINLYLFFKKNNNYHIIHGHMDSFGCIYSAMAWLGGVKIRIAHSHVAATEPTIKGAIKTCLNRFWRFATTDRFACSIKAGKYMFGNQDFLVINNAVDLTRFAMSGSKRKQIRQDLDCESSFVIGHIGRFEPQKNHVFLLHIFKSLLGIRPNSKLLLVGEGGQFEQVKNLADSLQITSSVKFLGVRKDTEALYQAMDVFVMPSLFEGLPVTGIEAQASGVPCVFSDQVTQEVNLGNATFLPLNADRFIWAKTIASITRKENHSEKLDEFNLAKEAPRLAALYMQLAGKASI